MTSEQISWGIRPFSHWDKCTDEWDQLNQRLCASPLLESRLIGLAIRYFGDGSEMIATARDARGLIVAATIIRKTGLASWSTFVSAQTPLGFWLSEPRQAVAALLRSLCRELGIRTLVLSAVQLDPEIIAPPEQDEGLRLDEYIPTAMIHIDRPWELFWSERGQNLRNNHKKARKRASDRGLSIELMTHSLPGELAEAVGLYGDIESSTWKASEGTAVARDNAQGRFYAELFAGMGEFDRARAYCLSIGGKPAAIDLCLRSHNCVIVLKTTFDAEFKEFSPASLLREQYFRQIFDDRTARRIEFYGRVMDWHLRWTSDVKSIYHITSFRSPLVRRLHHAVRRLKARSQPSLQAGE